MDDLASKYLTKVWRETLKRGGLINGIAQIRKRQSEEKVKNLRKLPRKDKYEIDGVWWYEYDQYSLMQLDKQVTRLSGFSTTTHTWSGFSTTTHTWSGFSTITHTRLGFYITMTHEVRLFYHNDSHEVEILYNDLKE
ncbi:unnamed protein product [Sphenostylis stenocarpa]|uniref:Uncharacterized protein n=1 Tax=Sphenostylis stenocarpa TaxID=92480 RepID=A0AA86VYZ4_9FABA|nr:unnamed protein product [Sphenostylis stenocarpa]